MADPDRLNKLRHDLANPLSAILAEAQLLLLEEHRLPPDVTTSLRQIESLAIRMRSLLKDVDPT